MVEGQLRGVLRHAPTGTNGFGYDPILQPEGETRTCAELSAEEKNAISHRGKAFRGWCRCCGSCWADFMEEPRTFESKVRGFSFLWARWDSNPRHTGPKPAPSGQLGYGPAASLTLPGLGDAVRGEIDLSRWLSGCGRKGTDTGGFRGGCPTGHH